MFYLLLLPHIGASGLSTDNCRAIQDYLLPLNFIFYPFTCYFYLLLLSLTFIFYFYLLPSIGVLKALN